MTVIFIEIITDIVLEYGGHFCLEFSDFHNRLGKLKITVAKSIRNHGHFGATER